MRNTVINNDGSVSVTFDKAEVEALLKYTNVEVLETGNGVLIECNRSHVINLARVLCCLIGEFKKANKKEGS